VFRRIPRVAQNILLALGSIVIALLLLELAARLLPSPYQGPADTAEVCSDGLGWRGKPGYRTTVATDDIVHNLALNSAGMHDAEHPFAKPTGTYRILMLGDSFVRAHQVKESETAHQVLEDLLNRDGQRHYEVISAGVDGWGTGQELLYYRAEGRRYQPDLVILMFYIGNDVKDNLPGRGITLDGRNCYAPYFVLCGDCLDPQPWLYAPGLPPSTGECSPVHKALSAILGTLHRHSRLYTQLEPLLPVPENRVAALDFYLENNPMFDYGLRLTLALVRQLSTEVTADGARFAAVLISPEDLVKFSLMSPAQREQVYQRLPALRRAEEAEPPNEHLQEMLSRQGISTLDLLPAFSRHLAETGEPLHFKQDKHWNIAGNRLAAQTMFEWLRTAVLR
jgi:hypothetical protein